MSRYMAWSARSSSWSAESAGRGTALPMLAVNVDLRLVTYSTTDYNTRTGCSSTSLDTLAFRDETGLRTSLTEAGFAVRDMYGDWDRGPVRPDCPELIVVAQKV